jgi:hypothetical protein
MYFLERAVLADLIHVKYGDVSPVFDYYALELCMGEVDISLKNRFIQGKRKGNMEGALPGLEPERENAKDH